MPYVHTDGRPAGARITPETHPGRWLPEDVALFRQGLCCHVTEQGNWTGTTHCGKPSDPEADFGYCTEDALRSEDEGGANWWSGLGEEHEDPSIDWKRDPALLEQHAQG
ncbi:hypothetical protein [Nonomuraea wenchangensis]|uniref:Uncharacterized protein n=1 Tax=Nonomuraea wenchangensis TaxID=568860 RepID=A0A1I0LU54_9ACTN|nr:hypothetical protein [Nonomuraea wenchangensis]SEU46742.1 hypothetical protein SAMN05421811_127134 [Nonomuraea wenchangensis]